MHTPTSFTMNITAFPTTFPATFPASCVPYSHYIALHPHTTHVSSLPPKRGRHGVLEPRGARPAAVSRATEPRTRGEQPGTGSRAVQSGGTAGALTCGVWRVACGVWRVACEDVGGLELRTERSRILTMCIRIVFALNPHCIHTEPTLTSHDPITAGRGDAAAGQYAARGGVHGQR